MANEYEVGYGKPPKQHRFKPGQSGNISGRRRKPKEPFSIIRGPVPMKVGEKSREVLGFEAGLRKTAQVAIEGRLSAIKRFITACESAKLLRGTRLEDLGGVLVVPFGVDFHAYVSVEANIDKLVQARDEERRLKESEKPKSERDAAIWKVANERFFVPAAGCKMTVLEIILHKLRAKALKEGHEASLAYFHKLNLQELVEVDGVEFGYLIVPEGPRRIEDLGFPIEDVEMD